MRRWLRYWRGGAIAVCLAALGMIGFVAVETRMLGPLSLTQTATVSVTVLDRRDQLLRAYTTADGKWRLPLSPAAVDPLYLEMLFAFEDRRYRLHRGVDPLSYVRIASEVIRHRRLVSGGSTLTMQTARLIEGRHERSARGKIRQMIRAAQLEQQLSKDEILELYLRLAPFGGNIEGVRGASLAYFGKEPARLSYAEAALLVAIPQSPNARRPDRHPADAKAARNRVLQVAAVRGVVPPQELARALREPVPQDRRSPPQLAAHLADEELRAQPARAVHRTTLDARLQASLEALARDHAKALGAGLSAAIVVVEHGSGEVRASVGSAGFLDAERLGAVDMTRAVRSPGSTLKPLIYGLGFDQGAIHPETLIEDRPTRFGSYVPKNFDHDWHGTVTIREALAKSLNIPAVAVLDTVGAVKLQGRLTAIGIAPQLPKDAAPSLAMALGGVGMTAHDLAVLYTAIARGGTGVRVRHQRDVSLLHGAAIEPRLMSEVAAFYLRDILKNAPPPAHARAGHIAYKTGTSYGYRDAWSAGFDGRHTIVVWVGRADGTPVAGLSGRASAAPLLFDAFHRIGERRTPFATAPQGVVRGMGRDLPITLQRFGRTADEDMVASGPVGGPAAATRERPLSIAFPPDRAELDADPGDGEPIMLKADGGRLPLNWFIDGRPLPTDPSSREAALDALGRGFAKVSVTDAAGRTDRVTIRLK
jgi:penicillin-binding protein 1C